MSWLGPRVLIAVLAAAMGCFLGEWLGRWLGWPLAGAMGGAAVLVAAAAIIDTLRGARLLGWLSGPLEGESPPIPGFWGEMGLRVERALRLREKAAQLESRRLTQFLAAIEASPNGVLLLDANQQIEWCSRVAADHLGLDPVRDLRQRITNLVRAPAFVALLQSRSPDQPAQIPMGHGRGQLTATLRPYGDGHWLLLTQDITERARSESMRRDFVSNVSHEIRTPLTVLSGFVETMSQLPLSEVERQRVLTLMGQQTRRMQALVGDLLTLAKLEGGPRPPMDHWLPLLRVGQAVESDARTLSGQRHQFSFDWGQGLEVAGNEAELMSGVGNLVNNAVRYTPEGGQISVTARWRADGAAEIAVRDTGPGVAPEHLPRLTERFYRVDGSRSRDTGGTGLGLSIVKHVAQRHGGELLIESELGHGSCFTLVLPASRVRAPHDAAPNLALEHS